VKDAPLIVVLAGGSNSRFWPLQGKSLVRFLGRTLIEHQLDAFFDAGCNDAIIVANPDTEAAVCSAVGRYGDRVAVAVQTEPRGMGDAVLVAAEAAGERLSGRALLVTQAHDVVDASIYRSVLAEMDGPADGALAGQEVADYFPGGYLALQSDRVMAVVEKPPPGSEPSRFVSFVVHLHKRPALLLDAIRQTYTSENTRDDHYERALTVLCGNLRYRLVPYQGIWQPIKYPWHVLEAMRMFLDRIPPQDGSLAENVIGNVVMEPGVRVLPGAHIVGPAYIGANTLIGTGALVRGAMIGSDCEIGYGCEVARSYVGDACVLHHNYVGDSVLEGRIGLGFGTVTGNWPFYPPPVRTTVDGERIRTDMEKFGAIIGSGCRTGIGVLLNPGTKVGRDTYIGPGVIVNRDIRGGQLLLAKQELIERENPFTRHDDES
jgi:UDP-N-acetylglucosamine diphosphorylase / glucose-1-phosphate thymidylyltransferase / UDP-N-acetylgalactosamine diphosphorylase / glucosamine-1-phosphate N-acetyltransferase / galactosamine-1-phosphate N-acetyltransferase